MKVLSVILVSILVLAVGVASATEFTLHLVKGWDYISIPLNITVDASDLGLDVEVWTYEDVWKQTTVIEPGKGYLIYSTTEKNITFEGEPLQLNATQILSLLKLGFNLIGVGINPINVSDFLGIPVYNESGRLNDTDTLLPGKAYWIYVDEHHYVLIHYDTDKDGKISGRELLKAIKDWKDNKLTGRQLLIVIDLWRQS